MKIVIAGHPKTGKTTIAGQFAEAGYKVYHTDDVIELGHGADSQAVSEWFDESGEWVVEGVTGPRAVRKWLDRHPGLPFPALVFYLREQVVPWDNKGTFVKGLDTVWAQVSDKVRSGTKEQLLRLAKELS